MQAEFLGKLYFVACLRLTAGMASVSLVIRLLDAVYVGGNALGLFRAQGLQGLMHAGGSTSGIAHVFNPVHASQQGINRFALKGGAGRMTPRAQLCVQLLTRIGAVRRHRSGFTSLDQSTAKLRWTVSLVMPPI